MTALISTRWYRVAALRPRLSPQARVTRQPLRGQTWYVLSHAATGRSVRLNAAAWAQAGRLDGRRSLQALWDAQMARPAEPATQDELIELLARLHEAGLLQLDRAADAEALLPHLDRLAREQKGPRTPWSWRWSLGDPSRRLARLQPWADALFRTPVFVAWALLVAAALALALWHAGALLQQAARLLPSPRFALLALVLFVPLKAVHELAHGLAVMRWGGRVRDAGLTFMFGAPVPYVDASAANALPQRHRRAVVASAGVMAELAIAALALPWALWCDDGWPRDAALALIVMAGVSSLLFNGNPLQRLDGYHLLCDLLGLPNLAGRSRAWWIERLQSVLCPAAVAEPMPVAAGERRWLWAYAPLSWGCSVGLAAVAVAWLGAWSAVAGTAAALCLAWQLGVVPLRRLVAALRRDALGSTVAARRWRLAVGGALALSLLLLAAPWPDALRAQGVVVPPEGTLLRAEEAGLVDELLVADGEAVHAGQPLLRLRSPRLQADLARQAARLAALETELLQALPGGRLEDESAARPPRRAGDLQADLAAAQTQANRLQERSEALVVRAAVAGRLALALSPADLHGRHLRQGEVVGRVQTDRPPQVRVAVPQAVAVDWRAAAARAIEVRLASDPWQGRDATLLRDAVGAVDELPSAALAQKHGGPVATDPEDARDLRPLKPVVLVDVALPADAVGPHEGQRAWVRFDHGWSPLAWQAMQGARRWWRQRMNPQA